nr:hypothetical protein [Tanacetum cinerariifolium]
MQRCSSKAGIKDCPLHRPKEQWLCCFACLGGETQKVLMLNRKKDKSTICLTHALGIPRHKGYGLFFTGGKAGEKHRACGLNSRTPPIRKAGAGSGFILGIVGRIKWDEALVDIASVMGRWLRLSGLKARERLRYSAQRRLFHTRRPDPLRLSHLPITLAISTKASSHLILPTIPNIKPLYNNSRQQERIAIDLGASQGRKIESIGNERRSGGTCETTYWNVESAPMRLAMPAWSPDTVKVP